MNKTEQRSRLKDVRDVIAATITSLQAEEENIQSVLRKAEMLDEALYNLGDEDSFNLDEFRENLFNGLFERQLEDVYRVASEFKEAIDEVIDDLSEVKAEELEDRYMHFEDDVVNRLDQSLRKYETIENTIEHLEEVMDAVDKLLFELL